MPDTPSLAVLWPGKDIANRRTRILAAAQEIFAQGGFHKAEVKQVAELAGVGKATIYKCFDSKEALLLAIVEENLNYIRDLALSHLVGREPPLSRLETACYAIADYLEKNREFARILIQEAGDFMGEIQARHLAEIEKTLPLADAFFAGLREQGYFVALPTRDIIQLFVDLLIGTTYTWAITGNGSLSESARNYIPILIAGLKDDPGKSEAI